MLNHRWLQWTTDILRRSLTDYVRHRDGGKCMGRRHRPSDACTRIKTPQWHRTVARLRELASWRCTRLLLLLLLQLRWRARLNHARPLHLEGAERWAFSTHAQNQSCGSKCASNSTVAAASFAVMVTSCRSRGSSVKNVAFCDTLRREWPNLSSRRSSRLLLDVNLSYLLVAVSTGFCCMSVEFTESQKQK